MKQVHETPLSPGPIGGPAAWRGALLTDPGDYTHQFSDQELAELDNAIEAHMASHRRMGEITPENFPLPKLSPVLSELSNHLLKGYGFRILRGFPLERYNTEGAAVAYVGIGSYLGSFRSQNAKGHLLGHVRNLEMDINQPTTRYYQTNKELEFHTDSTDLVGLLCLQTAQSGGASRLTSSVTLHDEIFRQRPDLWRVLFNAFPTDRRGEVPEGMRPWFDMPVFNWFSGQLTTIYVGQYIRSAQENFPAARRLSELEFEALDFLDLLCNDPDFYLSLDFQIGDMQFVHNHQILHARTDYLDWPEPNKRRHLLRLWLSPDAGRPLPEYFAPRYGGTKPGDRGGIVTEHTELEFSLQP